MFRIDHETAAAALPTPGSAGTPGYFTGGAPGEGVSPTVVTADWANAIQEEIMSVLDAASITPDKADHTQLLAALTALIPGGIEVSGDHISFPGGLTIQWGKYRASISSGATVNITLPHALSAAPLAVIFSLYDPSAGYNPNHLAAGNHTETTLTFRSALDDDGSPPGIPGFDWLAIGLAE